MKLIAALLFALILVAGSPAIAEDKDAVADKTAGGKEEAKKPTTPLGRLIGELKAMVAREKAKPEYDKSLVKNLEALIRIYERKVEQVKLEDLSEADRERLEEQVREKMRKEREAGGAGGRGGGGSRWADRIAEGATKDVKLSEAERKKVDPIIADYAKEVSSAYEQRDYKVIGDLKKDLERQLKRIIGNKRTRDIMNNINRASGRGRWGR